jgi:transketolase
VLFDDNGISIDGSTDLAVSDDQCKRVEASGWFAQAINGHDPEAIANAIRRAHESDRPSFIACRTTIGLGAPKKAGTSHAHGSPLGAEEIAGARVALDWPHAPFVIPEDILAAWRSCGQESGRAEPLKNLDAALLDKLLINLKAKFLEEKPNQGTRLSSQAVLEVFTTSFPQMIGGSADLTPSNNTRAKAQKEVTSSDFAGTYIHYGVREHAMAAVMNGISLHSQFIPYGGTFLIFSDYLRPALRLSALMQRQVIHVLTHDSIGLGEDGPTHQPIEQLSALRAIPNVNVFRPADAIEVAECWAQAMLDTKAPSVVALSRQNIRPIRLESTGENLCAKGGYVVYEPTRARQVTLIATGSEVGLAMDVQEKLEGEGVAVAVVSMPCTRLFDLQPAEYRKSVLGQGGLRVAIEAATSWGWERYIGDEGLMCGVQTFGASAPYKDVYKHFGLTPEGITQKIKERI